MTQKTDLLQMPIVKLAIVLLLAALIALIGTYVVSASEHLRVLCSLFVVTVLVRFLGYRGLIKPDLGLLKGILLYIIGIIVVWFLLKLIPLDINNGKTLLFIKIPLYLGIILLTGSLFAFKRK